MNDILTVEDVMQLGSVGLETLIPGKRTITGLLHYYRRRAGIKDERSSGWVEFTCDVPRCDH